MPTLSPHTIRCAACTETPPPFTKILCHGLYEGALKEAVHLLKFGGLRRLAQPLSELLASLPLPDADVIVPVPLHRNRLLEREFNQTAVLGRHLSRRVGLPIRLNALRKHRETRRQTAMTGKERLKNLRKAFTADASLKDVRILLLDDVITTTATVRECARTLREAGAPEVTVVALARSRPKL